MSFFCNPAKHSTIYPQPVKKPPPLFLQFNSVHVLISLGQEDVRKGRMFSKFCHNEKHELVFKVPFFEHYRNFML